MNEIKFAVRQLLKNPGFAAVAVLTLALGIGANSAIYSILNPVLFRPLPFHEPERLAWIANIDCCGLSGTTTRVANYQDWQRLNRSFEDIAAFSAFFDYASYSLLGQGEPERLKGVGVSRNFFPVLGIQPLLGRTFSEEESLWSGRKAVMLMHAFWMRRFNGDPAIVGQKLILNNEPTEVIGVLPAHFDFASVFSPGSKLELVLPFPIAPETDQWGNTLSLIGRLKPGVTHEQAEADLAALTKQIQANDRQRGTTWGAQVSPLQGHVNGQVRTALLVLFGAVGCVLLIACANLSNLMLVRWSGRHKEMAVRVALGASRWTLIRQMLVESTVLAFVGAALGLLLAQFLTRVVAGATGLNIPMMSQVRLDWTVLFFTIGITAATALMFGLLPALRLSRGNVQEILQEASRGTSAGHKNKLFRELLVVSEIAIACILLVAAGLLVRSFQRLLDTDPGFRPQQAMAWRIETSRSFASNAERVAYYENIRRRVASLPGVEAAGFADTLPLGRNRTWGIRAKGRVYRDGEWPSAFPRIVSAGYLETMGIPLRAGRTFTPHDTEKSEKVVVLNETAAKLLWPNEEAVGRMAINDGDVKVIGVVGDVRHSGLDEAPGAEMYFPMTQTSDFSAVELVIRTQHPLHALVPSVRATLREIDPTIPLTDYQPLQALVDQSVSARRFVVLLLGAFSFLALFLAALGIYGVLAYAVSQRKKEIGIRMAIGADRSTVLKSVMSAGARLAAFGIVLGMVGSFVSSRFLQSMVFGIGVTDPTTFMAIPLLFFAVAMAACFLPATRATRVSPAIVLRDD